MVTRWSHSDKCLCRFTRSGFLDNHIDGLTYCPKGTLDGVKRPRAYCYDP